MVSSTRRQSKTTQAPSKPRKAAKRRKRMRVIKNKPSSKPKPSWDPKQLFIVEYIANAKLVRKGKSRVWEYEVKWWGYKGEDNSQEFASQFATCEYPILSLFWKSVGQGGKEPDPRRYKGQEIVFESPPGYRYFETGITKKMARGDGNHGGDGSQIGDTDEVQSDASEPSDEELPNVNAQPIIHGTVHPSKKEGPLPRKKIRFKLGRGMAY